MIVPVVSFNEIPRSDWKRLPALIASRFNGRADVVVCTHQDQVSQGNMDELKTVTKAFWPKGASETNRVIPCSPIMALSARDLLDRSKFPKPPFWFIWENYTVGDYVRGPLLSIACADIAIQCASKILGVENPRTTYNRFSFQTWRDKIQAELRASGLPETIQWLTREIFNRAWVQERPSKAGTLTRQLREMRNVYGCVLLQYSLRSPRLLPADKDSFLRQGGSKPNATPQKGASIKCVRCLKQFWIRGVE
jgi:hypothetical protein